MRQGKTRQYKHLRQYKARQDNSTSYHTRRDKRDKTGQDNNRTFNTIKKGQGQTKKHDKTRQDASIQYNTRQDKTT